MFVLERKQSSSTSASVATRRASRSRLAKAPPVAQLRPAFAPSPLPTRPAVQTKLVVGGANDPLEHEADRVAEQVLRGAEGGPSVSGAPPQISRKCAACEEEEAQTVRTKRAAASDLDGHEASAIVYDALRSPGHALDASTRAFFEPRFGRDFSAVRIHADGQAASAARTLRARAYTLGADLVFGAGQYAPSTTEGQRLLAHELVHVVQQSPQSGAPLKAVVPVGQAASAPAVARAPSATVQRRVVCPPGVSEEEGTGCYETAEGEPTAETAISSPSPSASMTIGPPGSSTNPGDCSFAEHRALQDEVDKWCHGQKACSQGDSCATLWEKIGNFANCIKARTIVNAKCFKGGNVGHQIALASAVGALGNCWKIYNAKKCKQDPVDVPVPVPVPVEEPKPVYDKSFMQKMAELTGLTGAALIAYLIVSEGTRLIPVRNLIPVP